MKRLAGTIAVLLTLLAANSAQASVKVGSECEAGSSLIVGYQGIVFPLSASSTNPLPSSTPINGVATSWKVGSGSTDNLYERLKVLRAPPDSNIVQVVAETEQQPVTKGSGPIPMRIPVLAGDRFGLSGSLGSSVCNTGSTADIVGATAANGRPGQSEPFSDLSGYQLALSVTVEPDLDGDGFGDETQEPCPALITIEVPCPRVTSRQKTNLTKRAILAQVKVTSQASVRVFGQVTWRADKGRNHELIVGLHGGPTRTVKPDVAAVFRLPLGKAVIRRLNRLSPTRSLRAKLTARVTDLAGRVTEPQIRLRLPGRHRQ